ncbi:hypothetical protein FQN49_004705 [Arthroderma sp. PD_2]|nr:hypothetical protein FQN49_004705 [Arthroderma sp. PD_2]
MYPQPPPREYPDYATLTDRCATNRNMNMNMNMNMEHPDGQQSYFDLHRTPFIPFSPNDYNYDLAPSRLPPSPPTSPPYPAAHSPRHSPQDQYQQYQQQQDFYPSSLASLPRSMMKSAGHKRGALSLGSGRSGTAASHPSRFSRGSANTDVGQASDISIDLTDMLSEKLDEVINHMDMQVFSGREKDLYLDVDTGSPLQAGFDVASKASSGARSFLRSTASASASSTHGSHKTNYFAKVYHYANSRLPRTLAPLNLYISTWPLLCLAAQSSQSAYNRPTSVERETHVEGDPYLGTKPMVIKSVALDHMNLIVFAIRGTTRSSFTDWATNMNAEPASPAGFLDDPGNLCHAGFLSVARKMVRPVAQRLEQLLAENPSRAKFSLVITGHSAGGAVASLLYAHILSYTLRSELIYLRDRFKRIHCFTFGSPPVSLLPIDKPSDPKYAKWLFYTFINEGDPVVRADKPYIRSLINLYKSPAPQTKSRGSPTSSIPVKLNFLGKERRDSGDRGSVKARSRSAQEVSWSIPTPTLTLPGCLIVLRGNRDNPRDKNYVEAYLTHNEEMAGVVFGDVMMHMMTLYERRIQLLATDAVTAKVAR